MDASKSKCKAKRYLILFSAILLPMYLLRACVGGVANTETNFISFLRDGNSNLAALRNGLDTMIYGVLNQWLENQWRE